MSPIIFFEADAGLFTGKAHSYTNQTPGAFILYMKGGLHMPLYYDSDSLIFLTSTFRKSRRIHVHSGRCLYSIYLFATELVIANWILLPTTLYLSISLRECGIEIDSPSQRPCEASANPIHGRVFVQCVVYEGNLYRAWPSPMLGGRN